MSLSSLLGFFTGFDVFIVGVGEGRGAGAGGGGGVIAGSAACLDGIGRLAALINDGVDCPYNGNHMYEHTIHLYLKPSQ